ncbi:hypothetical protein [Desulfuromonas sp. CSMB_57]|uniref:hypothetical protein n=1 Tax=Desulfuromonas sp. CSMB_57 TaxID=2807629 RepID=UPI001CD24B1A|nr:hypothetical protein [Desulfuromonas sp. CSMB_57]
MTKKRELIFSILDWEARYILESISREMQRLKTVAEESDDEDEAADAGNDYLEIAGLKERFESEAIKVFGNLISENS